MGKNQIKEQAERLLAAVEEIQRSLEHEPAGSELDLTKPQLRTLMAISRANCVSMSELAKLTGYPTSALTGIIDRMLKKKLVRRVRDDGDRRIVKVVTSPLGEELAVGFRRKLMRCFSVVLGKIKPIERERMVAMVDKIASSFVKQNGH
jgi:DNA-binding MarR family transcriptional regulator